jgi:hypothetical protein
MLLKNNLMLASIVDWHCLDGMGKYLTKVNDLLLPFAPTNICPLRCLDGGVNVDVNERGRAGPPQICSNLLLFRGK